MYTHCPHCQTRFEVFAQHIFTANGKVRCGICRQVFNVKDFLHDHPLRATQDRPAGVEMGDQAPAISDVEDAGHTQVAGDVRQDIDQVLYETFSRRGYTPSGTIRKLSKQELFKQILWRFGILMLIVIAGLQIFWFNREMLLSRYPQALSYAELFCQYIQCELSQKGDPASIKLVDREVRVHPDFVNSLLINATIVNLLPTTQPYPDIQVVLFDTGGHIIGARILKPWQYMGQEVTIARGMPSKEHIHFVLEMTGAITEAISFEFRFL